jgi:hypothetical protein
MPIPNIQLDHLELLALCEFARNGSHQAISLDNIERVVFPHPLREGVLIDAGLIVPGKTPTGRNKGGWFHPGEYARETARVHIPRVLDRMELQLKNATLSASQIREYQDVMARLRKYQRDIDFLRPLPGDQEPEAKAPKKAAAARAQDTVPASSPPSAKPSARKAPKRLA